MESRVKKLLHRHHNHDNDNALDRDINQDSAHANGDLTTSVPTSPYANAKPASPPATGEYPIHGLRRHNSLNDKSRMFGLKRRCKS